MQLLYEVESILRAAGFRTARGRDLEGTVVFEDDTILGFVAIHPSAEDMTTRWKTLQDDFLRRNAAQLRRDPLKAWNTYSVFLTDAAVDDLSFMTLDIEADVQATRKIVRGGVVTRNEVQNALAPVLPLQVAPAMRTDSADAALNEKLDEEQRALFEMASDRDISDVRIVTWLLEVVR
jgi:hypothetical protein